MARSFWSKKKDQLAGATSYTNASSAVTKPASAFATILGVLLVGVVLYGVFWSARWGFGKLLGNDDTPKVTLGGNTSGDTLTPDTTQNTPITATSSTSTTTPSAQNPPTNTPSVVSAGPAPTTVPNTGAGTNMAVFFTVLGASYILYRKKSLNS